MVSFDSHAPIPSVSVGAPLPEPIARKVQRIEIESQRNLPTRCVVELWDDDGTAIDSPLLLPGRPLTVDAAPATDDPSATSIDPLFVGEVVTLEVDLAGDGGTRVRVCGYDKGHRLHRTRRTRTFLQQSDGMVVASVAGDHGLTPRADATPGIQEYLCQHNQTDWEFLAERARETGFELSVSGTTLVFRRAGADPLAGPPQSLARGENLLTFRARASSAAQPTTARVHSFDSTLKQPVQGLSMPAVPENVPGDPALLPATIGAAFGTTEEVVVDRPLGLQPAAIGLATAVRTHLAGTAFEADGSCIGNPSVRAGAQVTVQNVGIRFSGTYTVSSATHVFDESGYRTDFVVSGTHDRSLLGLTRAAAGDGATGGGGQTTPGLGKVSDTNDPLMLGRVRVDLPWLGSDAVSQWAPVVSAGAGSARGIQFIPEPDDLVLVVFEQGDLRRPYVLGGLWNSQDLPPEPMAVLGGETQRRTITTRVGHALTFDDTAGQESVTLTTAQGASLMMVDGGAASIVLTTGDGRSSLEIDGTSGDVTLTAGANLTVRGTGNLDLSATGNLDLSASGSVAISASAGLTLDGGARVAISGAKVDIN